MQPIAGRSKPSVNTMQLLTSSVSPEAKPGKDRVPVVLGCRAIHMLGLDAGFHEFVADVNAVRDIDTEHQGFPALAMLVPVTDDVADQVVAVHPIG